MITAASNALTQAVVVNQAVEVEEVVAVVVDETGIDADLPRTDILMFSRNNSLINPCGLSTM